jgi:hypothetical protein
MISHQDEAHMDEQLTMFIVDVMRHDEVENVDGILQLINNSTSIGWRAAWPHDFTEEEIIKGLRMLLEGKMVRPLIYDEVSKQIVDWRGSSSPSLDLRNLWFRITELGWKKWQQWIPPEEREEN